MTKKSSKKKRASRTRKKTRAELNVEKVLIENFVSLQKVMADLSARFDTLSERISKLLDLFEASAKALAEKGFEIEKKTDEKTEKAILEKLDTLAEQNKLIARGITLMHERIPSETAQSTYPSPSPQSVPSAISQQTQQPKTREIEEKTADVGKQPLSQPTKFQPLEKR